MKRNQINRFIILKNGEKITEVPSMKAVARFVGCTFQHIYNQIETDDFVKTNEFIYKKNIYTIIDKLEAIQ